jgi:hypothetical protein
MEQGVRECFPGQDIKQTRRRAYGRQGVRFLVTTARLFKMVQHNGVLLDAGWYYTPEMLGIIGKEWSLDDAGTVHIFSLSDKRPLFDAACLEYSGNVQEDIAKKDRLNKEKNALLKKYNKKKTEYDKESINTPAENYALKTMRQTELKVVNGESLILDTENSAPCLTLVKLDRVRISLGGKSGFPPTRIDKGSSSH